MGGKEPSYRDEARGSDSFSEEHQGLMSGVSSHPTVAKKFRNVARILPLVLFASLGLNLFQMIYLAFHRPKCLSLYGVYTREYSFKFRANAWSIAKLPENEINRVWIGPPR
jgi:hypothetical protein